MVEGLGKRLQEQRLNLRISQKDAAIALGVSPSIISNYESSERTPSVENLLALAGLYRCSTDYLLGITNTNQTCIDISMLTEKQRLYLQQFLDELNA